MLSSLYLALAGLLVVALMLRVALMRKRLGVGMGDGGHAELGRAIRVHANAVETLPLALLMLLAAEWGGTPAPLLHAAGITLLGGRLLHAWGMTGRSGYSPGRFWGTVATLLAYLYLVALLIYRSLLA